MHSRLRTGIFNPPVKLTATLPNVKIGNNNELLGKHQVILLILTRNTACILEENFRDQFQIINFKLHSSSDSCV